VQVPQIREEHVEIDKELIDKLLGVPNREWLSTVKAVRYAERKTSP
jgi:hypothetical protein